MARPQDDTRRARRTIVLAMAAALLGAVVFSAPAAAGPTPTPTPTAERATHKSLLPTHLPISIDLLGIHINLDLPLTLSGLLNPTTTASTSTAPPPPTSTPPARHHTTPPRSQSSPPPPHNTSSIAAGAQAVPPPPNGTASRTSAPPTHHPTHQPTKKPHKPGVLQQAGTALLHLLPTSLTRLLYLLVFLVGVGIAVTVMRMGRRGGRHTV